MDESPETSDVTASERPQQFLMIEAGLHAERERVKALAQDWRPSLTQDVRDARSPQLLGESLLRMHSSLGTLSERHDFLENVR
ncbi:MAG TPA: hypothetical protein VFU48_05540 [Nitrospira sp.]|nr:hypothetical protein [Nitrospira sp.]